MENKYTIGQLARLTDMSTKALRIYEEKGLISSTRNAENNYRFFDESVKLQLQRIQTLRYLGFSLDEIEKMLIHFNSVNLEDSFLEQKKMMEKKVFELNRMIHCMEKAAIECKEKEFDLDEVFKMLKHIIINRKADEGVGFLRMHSGTKEPEGWSRWIFDQVNIKSGMKIMDAGAGYGNLWRYNEERTPKDVKILCIDKHNTHADTFYEEFHEKKQFTFEWNDLETMEFKGKYDLIFFNHVIVFIDDKEKMLLKFRQILKKNGSFICTFGGTRLFDEMAKLFIEFRPELKESIEEGLKKRKQPNLDLSSVLEKSFPYVEKRSRVVPLLYDNVDDFVGYIAEVNKMGFDFSKYRDEFTEFILEKFPNGEYCIERDGFLFVCKN